MAHGCTFGEFGVGLALELCDGGEQVIEAPGFGKMIDTLLDLLLLGVGVGEVEDEEVNMGVHCDGVEEAHGWGLLKLIIAI